MVCHGTYFMRRLNQAIRVVQVGQGDRRDPHQRPVTAQETGMGMVLLRRRLEVAGGRLGLTG